MTLTLMATVIMAAEADPILVAVHVPFRDPGHSTMVTTEHRTQLQACP